MILSFVGGVQLAQPITNNHLLQPMGAPCVRYWTKYSKHGTVINYKIICLLLTNKIRHISKIILHDRCVCILVLTEFHNACVLFRCSYCQVWWTSKLQMHPLHSTRPLRKCIIHTPSVIQLISKCLLGPVYTTVEKASGRSRMLGQDMAI